MTTISSNSEGRVYMQKGLGGSYICQDMLQFQQTHVDPEPMASLQLLLLKLLYAEAQARWLFGFSS